MNFAELLPREGLRALWTGAALVLLVLELVYGLIWLVLAGIWLAWFAMLVDWARARQVDVPGKAMAVASWFVCGLNFGYPLVVLRKIAHETSVRTPIVWWWCVGVASLLLGTVATASMGEGGYDPLFIAASALELIPLYLCWRIPRDFRAADEAWNPRAGLAQRG